MLKCDSRLVEEGDTFIAIRGEYTDGHNYIYEAIEKGAKKIIAEHGSYNVETEIVLSTKKYLEEYLRKSLPDIKIIGVTGTNGKTTTCYLIWQIFNKLNIKCAYIGTLGFYLDKKIKDLINTTPGYMELLSLICEAYNNDCEYIVMEVSSQALSQERVNFIDFDYAIFTNITQDHLDYHKTMENYVEAKQRLFYLLKSNGIGIINDDDICSSYFQINNYFTYGYSECDYQIKGDDKFSINDQEYQMELVGKFNIYNMTSAICLFYQLGYNHQDLYKVISNCSAPEGRIDFIKKNKRNAIVDYAHSPDAVLNILDCIRNLKYEKIITVIGCGGNRDKGKRPIMGSIAVNNSDYVIFTSDNPRDENPDDILYDITNNLDKNNYEIESNREIAIKKGIQLLGKNDILIVLGKGHEKYQIIKNKKIFFDDKQIILDNI